MRIVVTAKEVSAPFDALIRGTQAREALEEWARVRRNPDGTRELSFDPADEQRKDLLRAVSRRHVWNFGNARSSPDLIASRQTDKEQRYHVQQHCSSLDRWCMGHFRSREPVDQSVRR